MVSSKMHIPCEHGGRWKVVSKVNQRLKTSPHSHRNKPGGQPQILA